MSESKNTVGEIPTERLREYATGANWYHTLELRPGIQTDGVYEHIPYLKHYGLPESLAGQSVLDVGAADGFFAFEFERRGAASVLALDNNRFSGELTTEVSPSRRESYVDKYKGMFQKNVAFADVYESLGVPYGHQLLAMIALRKSRVQYKTLDIYELAQLKKKYDFVFCGDLIEHLKNPLWALENLVVVTGKRCVVVLSSARKDRPGLSVLSRVLSRALGLPYTRKAVEYVGNEGGGSFFHFYPETFRQALLASGFKRVEIFDEFDLPNRKHGFDNFHVTYHCWV